MGRMKKPVEKSADVLRDEQLREQELAERRRLKEGLRRDEVGLQSGCVQAFEKYASKAKNEARRPLNDRSIESYEGIWFEWVMYLVSKEVGWRVATPDDVAGFLTTALRARNLARNSSARVSSVTQARYGRVLREIYMAALAEEDQHLNPVKLVGKGVSQSEAAFSLKLHGHVRQKLRQEMPKATDEKSARDRAVICLTLLEGMTCSDIMGLKLQDLLFKEGDNGVMSYGSENATAEEMQSWVRGYTEDDVGGGSLLAPEVAPRGAHLRGDRLAQDRRVAFRATTREALKTWLGYRENHRHGKLTQSVMLSLSRRLGKQEAGITYRALFQVCARHVDKALRGSTVMTDEEVQTLLHIGPNTLRNACLLDWMESGVDLEEVRRRAGLKEARSLGRLAYEHRERQPDEAEQAEPAEPAEPAEA